LKERTLLIIKPDGLERSLKDEIVNRIIKEGFEIVAEKTCRMPQGLAKELYQEHRAEAFFPELISYITSGKVCLIVLEGENVVKKTREIIGTTNPEKAAKGTIRGDYGLDICRNTVHSSSSLEAAEREIALYFRFFKLS